MAVVFVSVNQSYQAGMDATELAAVAHRAWALSLARAQAMDHLVAVVQKKALMAWPVLDAYLTEETYSTNGGERPRVAFALGAPVPVRPEWHESPDLRRGVVFDLDV
ncbi:hypothetical protein [Curtobacterium sp. CT11-133]|uniref:hypothetical protein n=1 Tax=Curtobacterium sp. CT11-133 TaxID=3243014 RepID=UPI0039AFD23A